MTSDLHPLNETANELKQRAYKRMQELNVLPEFRPLIYEDYLRMTTESQWTPCLVNLRQMRWDFFHKRST